VPVPVSFFSSLDRERQFVLFRWQWARREIVKRARRVVRLVEIDPHGSLRGKRGMQEPAAAVGALAVGAVAEHDKQCLIVRVLQHRIQAIFASVLVEYQRPRGVLFDLQAQKLSQIVSAVRDGAGSQQHDFRDGRGARRLHVKGCPIRDGRGNTADRRP